MHIETVRVLKNDEQVLEGTKVSPFSSFFPLGFSSVYLNRTHTVPSVHSAMKVYEDMMGVVLLVT